MLYRRGYINDEIGTYLISDVEKGGGSVRGSRRNRSRSELFAFYRCYILRVRVLCRFDAAWLMFRVEPDLAHDQTVNGYLHDTTEEELKGLTF